MKAFSEINKNSLENKFNMRRCDNGTLFSIERRSIICVLRQLNGEASLIFNCFCHRLQSYEWPGNTNHWMPKKLDLNVTSLTLNPLWVAGKWIPIVRNSFIVEDKKIESSSRRQLKNALAWREIWIERKCLYILNSFLIRCWVVLNIAI